MPNSIDYAAIFQTQLDEQFMQESTTAWMEANASRVRYNGGNTVKIPVIQTEGLGDYSRSSGFPEGAVTLTWEERTLTKDRGKEFNIDAQDVDESGFVVNAGLVLGEFQRVQVVPEIDAYRYSKIFSLCNAAAKTGSYTPAKETVYGQLKDDIKSIQDIVGENEPLVIAISHAAAGILDKSSEFEKSVSLIDFANGSLQTKVRSLDGIPMFRVPSARFKSAYTFSATDGFSATATAMQLNWIIASRAAVIAIVKTDKTRVFSPDVNQAADAWKVQLRKYHDLWIMDNKLDALFVSYTAIDAPELTVTIAQGSAAGKTKATATAASGNVLTISLSTAALTAEYNELLDSFTPYTSGADIAATAGQFLNVYEVNAAGRVQKFASVELAAGNIK